MSKIGEAAMSAGEGEFQAYVFEQNFYFEMFSDPYFSDETLKTPEKLGTKQQLDRISKTFLEGKSFSEALTDKERNLIKEKYIHNLNTKQAQQLHIFFTSNKDSKTSNKGSNKRIIVSKGLFKREYEHLTEAQQALVRMRYYLNQKVKRSNRGEKLYQEALKNFQANSTALVVPELSEANAAEKLGITLETYRKITQEGKNAEEARKRRGDAEVAAQRKANNNAAKLLEEQKAAKLVKERKAAEKAAENAAEEAAKNATRKREQNKNPKAAAAAPSNTLGFLRQVPHLSIGPSKGKPPAEPPSVPESTGNFLLDIKTAGDQGGEEAAYKAYRAHMKKAGFPEGNIPSQKSHIFQGILKEANAATYETLAKEAENNMARTGHGLVDLNLNNKSAWKLAFPDSQLPSLTSDLVALNAQIESAYEPYLGDEAVMTYQAGKNKTVKDVVRGHPRCGRAPPEEFCDWPVIHSEGAGNDCLVHSLLTAACPAFRRLTTPAKLQAARGFRRQVMPNFNDPAPGGRVDSSLMLEDPEVIALAKAYQINILTFRSPYGRHFSKIAMYVENPESDVYMISNETEAHFESVRTPDGRYTISFEQAKGIIDKEEQPDCPFQEGDIVYKKGNASRTPYYVIQRLFDEPPKCTRLRLGTQKQWDIFNRLSQKEKNSSVYTTLYGPNIVYSSSVEKAAGAAGNAGGAAGNAGGAGEGGGRRQRQRRHTRRRRKNPKPRQTKRRA